jgi:hypothetical protein
MLARFACAALILLGLVVGLSTGAVLGLALAEEDPAPLALRVTAD